MDQLKDRETKERAPEIEEKELKKITDAYRQMNPINRCFIVSASSMLLASQNTAGTEEREKEVV